MTPLCEQRAYRRSKRRGCRRLTNTLKQALPSTINKFRWGLLQIPNKASLENFLAFRRRHPLKLFDGNYSGSHSSTIAANHFFRL
jgi:hypothetical protein